ncbi:unnamed protein product, partial [Rotaria sordida]
ISLNDVDNISILGLDQGCILLFSATVLSRNSSIQRTIIGGIQLSDGDQKIYHRHPSCVKITHASINATRSLCCFVTRSESHHYEVFVAVIGLPNSGRLFSLKLSRSNPIRAYLGPDDIVLLLYRDAVTVFRMPYGENVPDKSVAVDRDAQINECIYYQWDTIQQRLHVIQKRSSTFMKTIPPNGFSPLVYTAYIINSKGQFDSIMTVDFDFKLPESSSSHSIFEILSNDTNLFLCWQSTMTEGTDKVEYAVVSLGHGRSFYVSKSLNQGHWEIFQSRRVHFGLLDGDYVFVVLRGEFVHLLNFNVQLNFINHLCFPNDTINLPYDTKYTTQRGLITKTSTLLYEKKNLFTYTIEICPNELIKTISSTNMESIIAYTLVAAKNNNISGQLLEQILLNMYDDLNTKAYLKEILTALIFLRLSKRIHHNKYVMVFPATTVNNRHTHNIEVPIRSFVHHRQHSPEHSGIINIDKEYCDKLRLLFDLSRRYRHRVSYYHPIMPSIDDNELKNDIVNGPSSPQTERQSSSSGVFSLRRKRESLSPYSDSHINDNPKSFILLDPKNKFLFHNVSHEIQQLHPSWEQGRIKDLAFEYILATQDQCDYLIRLFTRLANFDRTQALIDDDIVPQSKKYKSLLTVIEKLYLAMDELGFSPTNELQRVLLELSYRVMPFDRFVAAIDQNILTLTEEFVSRVILELDDDPESYTIKEQLIFMLPNINSDLHSRLFALIKNDRAKRTTAQLLVTRSFSTDNRHRSAISSSYAHATSHEIQVDEMMDMNSNQNGTNTHSRLVEQAVVTFFRDCNQRGILDEDEMSQVKTGLFSLASSAS